MIYNQRTVFARAYRYSPDTPRRGEMADAGPDCWAVEGVHSNDHFPTWMEPRARRTIVSPNGEKKTKDPKMVAPGHKASRTKGFAAEQVCCLAIEDLVVSR